MYSLSKIYRSSYYSPTVIGIRIKYHQDRIYYHPGITLRSSEDAAVVPDINSSWRTIAPLYYISRARAERRAQLGLYDGYTDFIDISLNINPDFLANVPVTLQDVIKNENQILLRKRKTLRKASLPTQKPSKWKHIDKRTQRSYNKTKTGFSKQ